MPIGKILHLSYWLTFIYHSLMNIYKIYGSEYIRFVDDFIVVCRTKDQVKRLWHYANDFLREKFHITLHPDKIYIQDVKKGVKFVGSVIKPGRIYLSNRSVGGGIYVYASFSR